MDGKIALFMIICMRLELLVRGQRRWHYEPKWPGFHSYSRTTGPFLVSIRAELRSVDKVEEVPSYYYNMSVNIFASWTDKRVQSNYSTVGIYGNMWVPDLIFFHESADDRKNGVEQAKLIVNSQGDVLYQKMVNIKVYPTYTDPRSENIMIRFSSGNATTTKILLEWNDVMREQRFDPYVLLRKYVIGKPHYEWKNGICSTNGVVTLRNKYLGDYSCLSVETTLKKDGISAELFIYVPASFCVFLSWCPFWMDKSSILGRSLMPIASLIHLLNQKFIVIKEEMSIKSPFAVNAWLFCCVIMVSMVLLQVAIVTYLYSISAERFLEASKKSNDTGIHMMGEMGDDSDGIIRLDEDDGYEVLTRKPLWKRLLYCLSPNAADSVNSMSRWVFPIVFTILLAVFIVHVF